MKITPRKYAQALALMLEASERAVIENFLMLLKSRQQLKLLPKILGAFEEEWLKRRGVVRIEARYPEKYPESIKELERRLKEKFGDKMVLKTVASKELIGGYQLRIGDMLVDATIKGRLKALGKRLKSHNQ